MHDVQDTIDDGQVPSIVDKHATRRLSANAKTSDIYINIYLNSNACDLLNLSPSRFRRSLLCCDASVGHRIRKCGECT